MLFLTSFFSGIFSGIGALIIELIAFSIISAYQYPDAYLLTEAAQSALLSSSLFLFTSAFIEEWMKFSILKQIAIKDIRSYLMRLPFLFVFGCGFASIELFIIFQTTNISLSTSSLTPVIPTILFHILSTIFIGFGLLLISRRYIRLSPAIPICTTFLHFTYNISVKQQMSENTYILLFLSLICILFLIFRPLQQPPFLRQ